MRIRNRAILSFLSCLVIILLYSSDSTGATVNLNVSVNPDGSVVATANATFATCGPDNWGHVYVSTSINTFPPYQECSVSGFGSATCSSTYDRADLNGEHTFTAVAYDCAGNVSDTKILTLDNRPVITVTSPTVPVGGESFDIAATVNFVPSLKTGDRNIFLLGGSGLTLLGNYFNCYPFSNVSPAQCSYYNPLPSGGWGLSLNCLSEVCNFSEPLSAFPGTHSINISATGGGGTATVTHEISRPCDVVIETPDSLTINPSSGERAVFSVGHNTGAPFTWNVSGDYPTSPSSTSLYSQTWDGKDAGRIATGSHTFNISAGYLDGQCSTSKQINVTVAGNPPTCLEMPVNSSANIASGNLYHDQTLFKVSDAKIPLNFILSYNSTDNYNGVLGLGWTHGYNISITANANDTYTLTDGDGSKTVLNQNGNFYTSTLSPYPALQVNIDGSYTLYKKDGTTYSFDLIGKITGITDRNSNMMTFGYDMGGNLTGITDPAGRVTLLNYSANKISSIIDPKGNTYTFAYSGDLLTGLSIPTSSGTGNWTYAYDIDGFMISKTNPSGNIVTYQYDTDHKLAHSTDPEGRTKAVVYPTEGAGNIWTSTFTEKDGGSWTFKYDSNAGVLTEKTDPQGVITRYVYDANKNLVSESDPLGNITTYTYDASNNMTSSTNALGQTTAYTYNSFGEVTTITDPLSNVTTYNYDTKGNLISAVDPSGAITQFQYDVKGNLTRIINPLNNATDFGYDSYNNLISVTDPVGAVTRFTYDIMGNPISQTDANGSVTTFMYNSINKLIETTAPDGSITRFAYDDNGNLISITDPNNKVTSYSYNPNNKLVSETDALGHSTSYTYWNTGGTDKLAELTDAMGNTTTYVYDYLGRVTSEWDPFTNSKLYNHDGKGNILAKIDEKGIYTSYAYDAESRLTNIWYHPEHPDATSVSFQYDARGKVTHAANQNITYNFTYDANGRITSVSDSNWRAVSYTYDAMGHRTQMTMPDGSVIQYGYDNVGRLIRITPNGSQPFSFTYDAGGRRTSLSYPNGITANYAYDVQNRLTSLIHSTSTGSNVDSFAYTLDNAGNRTVKTDNEYQYGYTYDATYRVTQCLPTQNMQGPLFQQSTEDFTYDAVGNRLTGPSYVKPVDYGIDYFYGYENRLVEVDNYHASYVDTITFKYDPFGRRIGKNVDTVENGVPTISNYTYVYDNEDIILEVLAKTQNGVTTTTTTAFVHGPGIDEPLSLARNGQTYYYHADGLGSITSMTDSAQAVVNRYAYDSFGALKKFETVRNTYSFTGREYDSETGLYLLRARYYDPETGKFVSKDPIGFKGGDVNVYNYTSGNPVNWVDPEGLFHYNASPPRTVPVQGKTLKALQCTEQCLQDASNNGSLDLLITGGAEQCGHSKNSDHYKGEAVDVAGSNYNPVSNSNVFSCSLKCGFEAGQFEEYRNSHKRDHWHLQIKPGNGRKLPCQVDSFKVEFPALFCRYSSGVRSPRASWGRRSL